MPKPSPTQLITCRISANALSSPTLPARLKILNWGSNDSVSGPIVVGRKTLAELLERQTAEGFEEVSIDYEHNTVKGSAIYDEEKEPREVAGYGKPVVIEDDGLYLENVRWTPSGQANAKNYADLSPAITIEDGEVVFVHSVALTRAGAVYDLHFLSSTLSAQPRTTDARCKAEKNKQPKTKNQKTNMDVTKILSALDLQEGAAEDEVLNKIAALKAALPAAQPAATSPPEDETVKLMSARLAKMEDAFAGMEKRQLVDDARRLGKVIPLTPDQLRDTPMATLRAIIENTRAVVPLTSNLGTVTASPGLDETELNRAVDKYKAEHGVNYVQAYNAVRRLQPQLFGLTASA